MSETIIITRLAIMITLEGSQAKEHPSANAETPQQGQETDPEVVIMDRFGVPACFGACLQKQTKQTIKDEQDDDRASQPPLSVCSASMAYGQTKQTTKDEQDDDRASQPPMSRSDPDPTVPALSRSSSLAPTEIFDEAGFPVLATTPPRAAAVQDQSRNENKDTPNTKNYQGTANQDTP